MIFKRQIRILTSLTKEETIKYFEDILSNNENFDGEFYFDQYKGGFSNKSLISVNINCTINELKNCTEIFFIFKANIVVYIFLLIMTLLGVILFFLSRQSIIDIYKLGPYNVDFMIFVLLLFFYLKAFLEFDSQCSNILYYFDSVDDFK